MNGLHVQILPKRNNERKGFVEVFEIVVTATLSRKKRLTN